LDQICQEDGEAKARLEKMAAAERKQLMAAPSMLVLMLQLSEGKPFDLIVADVIRRLPSDEDYPVYQVFGVICSFYQYGIFTSTGVLPLCLPDYSKKAVRDVVDFARDAELQGLVIKISRGGWFTWSKIYAAVGLLAERDRCWDAILSTEPQSLWEWTYWLSLIQRRGTNQQKQEAIALTTTWLQLHPDDHEVRKQYLALIRRSL
jgi:hypothetical protein